MVLFNVPPKWNDSTESTVECMSKKEASDSGKCGACAMRMICGIDNWMGTGREDGLGATEEYCFDDLNSVLLKNKQ